MTIFMIVGLLTGLFTPITAAAEENNDSSPQQLKVYQEDVTGDTAKETIKLYGTSLAPDSDYYADIWATISISDEAEWEIPYEGGYEPEIQFYDLNHNDVNDLLYQSATGGSGGLYHYHLHTFEHGQLNEIPLPEQESVKGEFKDGFQVAIQIDHEQKPAIVDVSNRSSEYVRLGIYDENGKLLDKTSPMIAPIAFFEPVKISDRKGYGLKSYQQISGAYRADQLGTVETLWYYENDQWLILKTEWLPS
ncbi:hypothetical protein [Lentibacillus salinarum]|uniref:Spore coat protein n=1 Tax=Lentibacillus salinarum TaxID=446820 RepID=A0ABW3ZSQ9_9BACI